MEVKVDGPRPKSEVVTGLFYTARVGHQMHFPTNLMVGGRWLGGVPSKRHIAVAFSPICGSDDVTSGSCDIAFPSNACEPRQPNDPITYTHNHHITNIKW